MIFLLFFSFSQGRKVENIENILDDLNNLAKDITTIRFKQGDYINQNDDVIDVELVSKEIINKSSKLSSFGSYFNKNDNFLNGKCNNCIKVEAQSVKFTFRSMKKSYVNQIKLYQSEDDDCSIIQAQFSFYAQTHQVYSTDFIPINKMSCWIYNIPRTIFDEVIVQATSDNPSLLCLGELAFLNK